MFPFTAPFVTTPGFNPRAPSPGYTPPVLGGFPGAGSQSFPGVVSSEQGPLLGYEDPRKAQMQAMAAALMASAAPSNIRSSPGAALGKAQLAGLSARNEQQERINAARAEQQRSEYMAAQMKQMQAAEDRRSRQEVLLKDFKINPQAKPEEQAVQLRALAGQLFAGGEYEAGMQAIARADAIYNPLDVEAKQAQIAASRASAAASRRGPAPNYNYITAGDGKVYAVREGASSGTVVTGPDGNPLMSKDAMKDNPSLVPMKPAEIKNVRTELDNVKQLSTWLAQSGEENFGSAGMTNLWDRTYGAMTSSHDYAMQRRLDAVTSGAVLDAAQKMKGALSDKDIMFLKETQPNKSDPVEYKKKWLIDLHDRMARNLEARGEQVEFLGDGSGDAGGGVFSTYGLEGPQR